MTSHDEGDYQGSKYREISPGTSIICYLSKKTGNGANRCDMSKCK